MQLSDQLLCLFNATIEESEDGYHVRVPERELENDVLETDSPYRVAILTQPSPESEPKEDAAPSRPERREGPQPPVEEGEVRYVEIEDIGKQGDGIARVERGYVIIVPETAVGDQVKIEITDVKSNFAVAEVIDEELS